MNLFTWDLLEFVAVATTLPLLVALAGARLLQANAGFAHGALVGGLVLALLLSGSGILQYASSPDTARPVSTELPQLIFALMLAGTIVMAGRLALSCVMGLALLRRAEPMTDDTLYPILKVAGQGRRPLPVLFATRDVKSPAIWCWGLRPALLIPEGVAGNRSPSIWRGVFEHELAHVRRRDNVWTLFSEFALCLLYWHPLAHILRWRLYECADIACDDYAAEQIADRALYAEALLSFSVQPRSIAALSLASDANALKRRIQRVLSDDVGKTRVGAVRALAVFSLYLAGFGGALYAAPNAPRATSGPEKENLIQNAGFQTGKDAPDHWVPGNPVEGVSQQWIQEGDTVKTSYFRFTKTAKRYFPIARVFQEVNVPIPPGSTHVEVGARVRCEKLTKAVIDVEFEDADGNWSHAWAVYLGPKEANEAAWTHDWKPYTGQVTLPPGTQKVTLSLQLYGPGQVDFDDAWLHFSTVDKSEGEQ